MSIKSIVTGGAHSAYGNEKGGDQKQNGKPDYSGEVSMRNKTEQAFLSSYAGYTLYRLINVSQASEAANLMIQACNNPNVGYSQNSSRQQIFQYGVDSATPINCDCSSLVCYCLTQATGKSFNTNTTGLKDALPKSGLFMSPIAATSVNFSTNPPCNGDVLLKPGSHVEMVVSGNPRDGKESEITAGTWVGDGNALQSYSNAYGTTYTFSPRKTAPSKDNEYYQHNYGETANGSYAWGRFSEIMRSPCNVSRGVPKRWYVYKEDGYKRGTAPLPGAIMCWSDVYDNNDAGIAAIVEEVNPNSINISWRHPRTGVFEYKSLVKDNGSWDLDIDGDGTKEFHFQGFIYNPAVDAEATVAPSSGSFIRNANAQVGNNGSYLAKYTPDVIPKRDPWAAAFIVAVAMQTGGIIDHIIPNTYSCSNIGRLGVNRDMGTWFDGPAQGGNPTPHSGDIVLIRTTALSNYDDYRYNADKAGIVYRVTKADKSKTGKNQTSGRVIEVIMGDVADKVQKIQFSTNSGQISGYFRPNWDKIDGYTHEVKEIIEDDGLYTEGTSMEDAALRDLRYVNITSTGLEPSIKSTGLTLSAINYTGMLANFYTAFVESGTCPGYDGDTMRTGGYYDESGEFVIPPGYSTAVDGIEMTPTVEAVYKQLTQALGSSAAAIGILGNIYQESHFNTAAVGDSGTSAGICQWHLGRKSDMIAYCNAHGGNWQTNLSGQVGYLVQELKTNYNSLMMKLRYVNDSEEGARQAADMFVREFERPKNAAQRSVERQDYSSAYWGLVRG